LVICSRVHRLLQDDLAALEVAGDVRAHRVLADVAGAVLVHMALALGAGAQRLLAEKSTGSPSPSPLASSPKSNSSFQLLDLVVAHQLELGGERPARLGAEALQRADLLVAHERLTSASSKLRRPGSW
jgi:hypothetical protein